MKLLITGFEAFLHNAENPTEKLIHYMDKHPIEGVKGIVLPVVYEEAFQTLLTSPYFQEAEAIVLFGLAQNRKHVEIERVAINIMDASGKDNTGVIKTDEAIIQDAPTAYFTKLPFRNLIVSLKEEGIDTKVSNSAGTYVCNDLFYRVMHHEALHQNNRPVGFVHVPEFSDNFTLEQFYQIVTLFSKMLG